MRDNTDKINLDLSEYVQDDNGSVTNSQVFSPPPLRTFATTR